MPPLRILSPCIAATIGLLSILGWLTGSEILKRGIAVSNTVNPMTAILIVLAGLGLLAHGSRNSPYVARGCGAAVTVLAAVVLHSIVFGWHGGPDTWLFHGVPSRMAPMAATSLGLLGVSILLLQTGPRGAAAAQYLALIVFVPPLVAVVGYIDTLGGLVAIGRTSPMAILTAVSLAALAIGLLLAEP